MFGYPAVCWLVRRRIFTSSWMCFARLRALKKSWGIKIHFCFFGRNLDDEPAENNEQRRVVKKKDMILVITSVIGVSRPPRSVAFSSLDSWNLARNAWTTWALTSRRWLRGINISIHSSSQLFLMNLFFKKCSDKSQDTRTSLFQSECPKTIMPDFLQQMAVTLHTHTFTQVKLLKQTETWVRIRSEERKTSLKKNYLKKKSEQACPYKNKADNISISTQLWL